MNSSFSFPSLSVRCAVETPLIIGVVHVPHVRCINENFVRNFLRHSEQCMKSMEYPHATSMKNKGADRKCKNDRTFFLPI